MATGNAYEMEMNGAQKANKTMETTAARDNGPVAMALRIRLVVPAFVCSFVFLPLFSTSAVTLLLPLLLLFSLLLPVVVLFWQLLLLLLLQLFFARLVTRAKVAACAVPKERKNCCAIASTVA